MALVSKTFSQIITFTRASTATYFDSAGTLQNAAIDAQRLDYDPSTLAAQGLLIEESRSNLILQSEDFATTWGLVTGTVTTNAATAPSGTVTADALVTSGVSAQVFQGLTITSGATVTGSVFLKQNGLTEVEIVLLSNANTTPYGRATFNVSLGAISVAATSSNGGLNASAIITNVGNGWYRCSVTVTYPAVTAAGMRIFSAGATGSVYAWGAQVEAGAFPTSYIPTTTTALTRAADVASVNTLSPWFNASAGTVYVEAVGVNNTAAVTRRFLEVSDGSINERFILGYSTTSSTRFLIFDAGILQADVQVSTGVSAGSLVKMASAYATNDFQQASNTTLGVADTSGTLPTVTTMYLGSDNIQGAGTMLNGYLRRITYYPRRLSNAELQALTV